MFLAGNGEYTFLVENGEYMYMLIKLRAIKLDPNCDDPKWSRW